MGDFDLDLKNSKSRSGETSNAISLVYCPPGITVPIVNCASHHYCGFTQESTCHIYFSECGCPPIDPGSLNDCINGI